MLRLGGNLLIFAIICASTSGKSFGEGRNEITSEILLQQPALESNLTANISAENFTAFISYRRSASRSLAMLIKVMFERENINAYLDVEDLHNGFANEQLMTNLIAAPNFIMVLSKGSLDRCIGDTNYTDVLHREIKEAVDYNRNIIPIFDEYDFPPDDVFSVEIQTAMRFQGIAWEHRLTEASLQKLIRYLAQPANLSVIANTKLPENKETLLQLPTGQES